MLVTIQDDFDLQKIADSGQCFRCAPVEGTYRFMTGEQAIYLKKLSVTDYEVSCTADEWEDIWNPYFDFGRDYKSIRETMTDDPFIAQAADFGQGIRILNQDPWETLITFIISQRKSIPAIKKAVEALAAACGTTTETGRETLHTFPTPEALARVDSKTLASCGLGYRVPYIEDAARKVAEGSLDLTAVRSLTEDGLLETLESVKGVGIKVASCVMLFAYGRTKSVPVDTWIKKIIEEKYHGENIFLKYGDNAGIAQQYAFYYIQKHKDEV